MTTHSAAPTASPIHDRLQHRLLCNASSAAHPPQADALRMTTVPLVPEIRLLLADDPMLLWARLEAAAETALPAPFWASAWTGGQALARYVLDHPEVVAGRRVLDLAAGSGLVAIAAALAGAAKVTANDIDGYALAAVRANAAANGVRVDCAGGDLTGGDGGDAEVILAGDALYSSDLAARMLPFVQRAAGRGAVVLFGDPGRGYAPDGPLRTLATYRLATMGSAEDAQHEQTSVLALAGSALAG